MGKQKEHLYSPALNKVGKRIQNKKAINRISVILGFMILCTVNVYAQSGIDDYERIGIGDAKHMLVGLALSPDGNTIAISGMQNYPMYIYDWRTDKVLKKFDVGNWYAGSRIKYSSSGKYILLQQLYYIDWAPNKDREVNFEIIDAATGEVVKKFDDYHSVSITPDEKYALTLTGEEVAFWNLENGKKERSFKVPMASNAVAISPDMKHIAVSHHLDSKELKKNPAMKKKKGKFIKNTAKFKQKVSVYSTGNFSLQYTINRFYDIIYKLEYSPDGKTLFCMNIPHIKAQTGQQRLTYINTINTENGEAQRLGFTSSAPYEPEFKLSNNGKLFGLISQGTRFVELHVYDFETGNMLQRFEQSYRLFEKSEGEMIIADSRTSFDFLPGDEYILMTMGNNILKWNLKLNQQ